MPLQSWDSRRTELPAPWVVPLEAGINHFPSLHEALGARKSRNGLELKATFILLLAQDVPEATYGAMFCSGV